MEADKLGDRVGALLARGLERNPSHPACRRCVPSRLHIEPIGDVRVIPGESNWTAPGLPCGILIKCFARSLNGKPEATAIRDSR